jgi:hypothetical protein
MNNGIYISSKVVRALAFAFALVTVVGIAMQVPEIIRYWKAETM